MHEIKGISPARIAFDRRFRTTILGALDLALGRWLLLANAANAVIVVGAVAVPLFAATGWSGLAGDLFSAYSALCARLPERSYFLLGHQTAMDQRMMAIYGASLAAGLAFVPFRKTLRPLSWRNLIWLTLPLALDGFTQLFGWRESNWFLRTVTGAAFGAGTVWFGYPRIEREVLSLLVPRPKVAAKMGEVS